MMLPFSCTFPVVSRWLATLRRSVLRRRLCEASLIGQFLLVLTLAARAEPPRPRPGFTVELVAAEPLIQSPVAFDWGPDGRLWVVEMRDYPLGLDNKGKPGGRVVVLEDTDG